MNHNKHNKRVNNTVAAILVALLFMSVAIVGIIAIPNATATPTEIPGYQYYRKISLNGLNTTITGYELDFALYNSTGTDNLTDHKIYLNGHVKNGSFNDVRFAHPNGTLLAYYRTNYTTNISANYTVNITSIDNVTGASIYLWYGNSSTTSDLSDGSDTFRLYDDFAWDPTRVERVERASATLTRNMNASLYRDYGAGAINGFKYNFTVTTGGTSVGDGATGMISLMCITNNLTDTKNFSGADIYVRVKHVTSPGVEFALIVGAGGAGATNKSTVAGSINTPRYCTINRTAGHNHTNLSVYSDSGRTTLLAYYTTNGLTEWIGDTTYQYIMPINSYLDGGGTDRYTTTIENITNGVEIFNLTEDFTLNPNATRNKYGIGISLARFNYTYNTSLWTHYNCIVSYVNDSAGNGCIQLFSSNYNQHGMLNSTNTYRNASVTFHLPSPGDNTGFLNYGWHSGDLEDGVNRDIFYWQVHPVPIGQDNYTQGRIRIDDADTNSSNKGDIVYPDHYTGTITVSHNDSYVAILKNNALNASSYVTDYSDTRVWFGGGVQLAGACTLDCVVVRGYYGPNTLITLASVGSEVDVTGLAHSLTLTLTSYVPLLLLIIFIIIILGLLLGAKRHTE